MIRVPVPLAPRWLRWAGVVVVAIIILYFSLFATVPEPPGNRGLAEIWDKNLHFAAYAGFAVALAYATVEWKSRWMVRSGSVFSVAVVFGLAVEVVQGRLPMRYYSHVDLLANLIGVSLVVPWLVLERHFRYVQLR